MSDKTFKEDKKVFSKEEIEAGLQIAHSEYFMQVIALASHDESLKELTYIKVPIQTPQGGTYLISILHIDGPKVDLRDLATKAEDSENKNG